MNILKNIQSALYLFGFDLIKFKSSILGIGFFTRDYFRVKRILKNNKDFKFGRLYPVFNERNLESGIMKGGYFHQDLLIAKKVFNNNPEKHVDIGSRIDGFIAHVAVFRKIEVFDIRPQKKVIESIIFKQADLMQLPSELTNYCDSISSLHAIEHFGLGRYGDPIDIDGHLKAIENIWKMLLPKGKFYFSVPIGYQRIEFNAHRIFSVKYLISILKEKFTIDNFSYVDDNGDLFENVALNYDQSFYNSLDFHFGLGIFELTKK